MTHSTLVLFDLDYTLLGGDTQSTWGNYLADLGVIDLTTYQEKMREFDLAYQEGKLNVAALLSFQMEILRPYSPQELDLWRHNFVRERIAPLLVEEMTQRLVEHQSQGDEVVLITATNKFLAAPIAQFLNIENIIALQEECDAKGKYTGRFLGTPPYREGKVIRLREWLAEQKSSLEDYHEIWFYSDSHNDLPLFLEATHRVAVNPDKILRDYAVREKWPIIDPKQH